MQKATNMNQHSMSQNQINKRYKNQIIQQTGKKDQGDYLETFLKTINSCIK